MDLYSKSAVAAGALSDALLYFDHVVPITFVVDFGMTLQREYKAGRHPYAENELEVITKALLTDALPPELQNENFKTRLIELYTLMSTTLLAAAKRGSWEGTEEVNQLIPKAERFLQDFSLRNLPLCTSPCYLGNAAETDSTDISLTLASLQLIDTEKTSIEQLADFRRDPEMKHKLRRLRLFAYENYKGKSPAFIEDDLLKRLDDYAEVVKKSGFETKAAAWTNLMDSRLIQGGIAGSFLTAYLHAPSLTAASALLTTGITIGKVAVDLGKQKFALRKLMADNPVSYIDYAKKKLEP
jgi:hypothetical protein